MKITDITKSTVEVLDYPISARETPAHGARVSAKLAARLGLPPADIADALHQGFYVAKSWAEYDRLLALYDERDRAGRRRCPFEPEGPWADDDVRDDDVRDDDVRDEQDEHDSGISERTERRYRGERKSEIVALIARDGRVTINSAIKKVTSRKTPDWRRWLKVCDECAQPFEAKRSDARFCGDSCRKRAARRSR